MIASMRGIEIAIEDYGICILMQHDLTQHAFFVWILWRAEHGQIHWLLGGRPCGAWPIARFSPHPGPPPVRTRSLPWGLPNLSETQARDVRVGTKLLLNFIKLCHAVAEGGG